MSDVWAPVIAALGASGLTGLFGWGVSAWNLRRMGRSAKTDACRRSYLALLESSSRLIAMGQNTNVTLKHRTGVGEALGVFVGLRKPIDLQTVQDRFGQELTSIIDSLTLVWTVGSQDGIDAGDKLAVAASDYLAASGAMTPWQLKWISLTGWNPTRAQTKELDRKLRELMESRAAFVQVVRREFREVPVTLSIEGQTIPATSRDRAPRPWQKTHWRRRPRPWSGPAPANAPHQRPLQARHETSPRRSAPTPAP